MPGTLFQAARLCRWADVEASDEEDEALASTAAGSIAEEPEVGLLPIEDESYQEAPLSLCERESLNQRLRATRLEPGPKDFAGLALEAGEAAGGIEPAHAWNTDAIEFIPTLTMTCPLIGVCHVIPEDQDAAALKEQSALMGWSVQGCLNSSEPEVFSLCTPRPGSDAAEHFDLNTPLVTPRRNGDAGTGSEHSLESCEKDTQQVRFYSGPGSQASSQGSTPKARHRSRKRRSRPLEVITTKRSKSGERERDADSVRRSQEVEEDGEDGKQEMGSRRPSDQEVPEASEEDWERRFAMRSKAIEIGKATPEYEWYALRALRGERLDSSPRTPNPADRSISKRSWKWHVQEWRREVRELFLASGEALPEAPGAGAAEPEGFGEDGR